MRRLLHPLGRPLLVTALSLIVLHAVSAQEPSPLDRIVGPDVFGKPIVITQLNALSVGALAGAARVPMGLEAVKRDGVVAVWKVKASGQPLRTVLDAIVAADSRYEWHDEAGVVVFRPRWASADLENRLHRLVGPIQAHEIQASDAMRIVARLFGAELPTANSPRDMKRFSVDLPPGRVIDALDAIVRAHGTMAWAFEPTKPAQPGLERFQDPFTAWLIAGGVGEAFGVGVKADATPQDLRPSEVIPRRPPTGPILNRIVGSRSNGQPLVVDGAANLYSLAEATHAPMGIQVLPRKESPAGELSITVTGMSLRDALSAFTAMDPRYGWREIDGVIVVRPWAGWSDETDRLSEHVDGIRLDRVTVSEVIRLERSLLEPGTNYGAGFNSALDAYRFSVDAPGGSHFSLLNAIVRAHGSLCWVFDEDETPRFDGRKLRRYRLTFHAAGFGSGFTFP